MASTPEGKVKAAVKRLLQSIGCWFYMPIQNGMGVTGIPDFIACIRGHFVAIECKAPGKAKNTTANQKLQLEQIGGAGGYAWVIDDPKVLETNLKILGWM